MCWKPQESVKAPVWIASSITWHLDLHVQICVHRCRWIIANTAQTCKKELEAYAFLHGLWTTRSYQNYFLVDIVQEEQMKLIFGFVIKVSWIQYPHFLGSLGWKPLRFPAQDFCNLFKEGNWLCSDNHVVVIIIITVKRCVGGSLSTFFSKLGALFSKYVVNSSQKLAIQVILT